MLGNKKKDTNAIERERDDVIAMLGKEGERSPLQQRYYNRWIGKYLYMTTTEEQSFPCTARDLAVNQYKHLHKKI